MYNQSVMSTVTIHHIRPGKEKQIFEEGFVAEDHQGLATFTVLSDEISHSLTERLRSDGYIEPDRTIHAVEKYYPRDEPFNLLIFRDQNNKVLGYYSDIVVPLRRVGDGHELIDLFLDIWLKPDGTLLELDVDEFQDAIEKHLITKEQQALATTAFERLKQEARQGIYPQKYIRT